ncbi:MAG: hypothetical protein ABID54_03300 [Pseudomonadota bacterium]
MGYPIEGEQEGESQPEEAGRGKYSPPAGPERVTAEVPERRDKGVHLHNAGLLMNSRCSENTSPETRETSVKRGGIAYDRERYPS